MAPLYQHTNRQKIVIPQPPNLGQPWTIRLAFDGSNGGTTITDSSATNRQTLQAHNSASISTTRSQFGGSSLYLPGIGGNRVVNTGTDSSFAFGAGDFTIEFWYYVSSWSSGYSGYYSAVYDNYSGSNSGRVLIYHNSNRKLVFWCNLSNILVSNTTISLDTWYRVALVRSSGTVKWVINGALDSTTTSSVAILQQGLYIGTNFDFNTAGNVQFNGFIDEFRMINSALY